MKSQTLALLTAVFAVPAAAQDHREMDAHVHGVTKLELAIEAGRVEIALHAPGMDIVGFEHAPGSDVDEAAVEAAVAYLMAPENVIALPEAAGCSLAEATAELEGDDEDHGEEHAEHEHEEHEHDEEHAEDDHSGHSEFHAAYAFTCTGPEALTEIGFPFFETFPNAEEIEAQFVTETGAGSAEIPRAAPKLTLQ